MARQSIDEYVETLKELPYAGNVLSSRRPLAVPGTYSEAVGAIKERVSPSVLPVVGTSVRVLQDENIADAPYAATILTSDGWVLTDARAESLGVLMDRAWLPFEMFLRVPETRFAFGKIERATGPVVTFGLPEAATLGMPVFVYDGVALYSRTLSKLDDGERPTRERAEMAWRLFRLDQPVDVRGGAIVVDASGALIGVMENELQVRPWHTMRGFLEYAFSEDGALGTTPALGVSVIDRVAVFDTRVGAPACCDEHVLAPLPLVGHRRRTRCSRQPAGPQFRARPGVEGTQIAVECGADENQAARRNHRPAEI